MIDLHMHSTFSDGTITPEGLVKEAREVGLEAIALTDHDGVEGLDSFLVACQDGKGNDYPEGIAGIEISAAIQNGELHLLGYFLDYKDAHFLAALERIRCGRKHRNLSILKKLNDLGISLDLESVSSFAGSEVIGRPHFAAALIDKGYVKSKREAFNSYLGKGKVAYAERFRVSPEESIRWIRKAGGVAVLAHPITLGLDKRLTQMFISDLRDMGLGGIEVYCPLHRREEISYYEYLAKLFDLVTTGGSDYHGLASPNINMGRGFGSLKVPLHIVEELRSRRA